MRQLADILQERSDKEGGHAALGRLLGLTGQAIGQYINEAKMPSFATALKWKEVYNENLIDLMFADENKVSMVNEPPINGMNKTQVEMEETIKTLEKLLNEYRTRFADLKKEVPKKGQASKG